MLEEYLRRQDGEITLAQARRCGISAAAVERRVRSDQWRRCARSVYFADDRPFTDAARVRSAVWGYGDQAAVSGLAAAWWLDLTRFAPDVVEVTVPRTVTVANTPAPAPDVVTSRRRTSSSTTEFGRRPCH